ncbi:MAG: pilus assembly PilX N-terminal domain-containing protein [Deltaproteobacteria bacterium]|nr:pilus assembly PilX N-terminal domain-containing protein [Deltaproteobacteria bacterium]
MNTLRVSSGNDSGRTLVVAVFSLALLLVIGTTLVIHSSASIWMSRNCTRERQAFYDAEAGVQYVLGNLKADLGAGNIDLSNDPVYLHYSRPTGFSFDLPATLTKLSANRYHFSVVGRAPDTTSATINVDIITKRKSAFDFGLFADGLVDLKAASGIYSFDSRKTSNPLPQDSTNDGDVGSNTEINVYMDTFIDGDAALGTDAGGTPGVWNESGVPIINGGRGIHTGRVNPDPLGAIEGPLAQQFTGVATANDNALATGSGMSGAVLHVGNGQTLTLHGKPGGANYHVRSFILKNGAMLNIDSSAGPVNIFLTGDHDMSGGNLETVNDATINYSGPPTQFRIFSNSIKSIVFRHAGGFKGMVYAPYARVEMKNDGDAYGLIWGKTVDIKNSGEFYFDTAFKDLYPINAYTLNAFIWRETIPQ